MEIRIEDYSKLKELHNKIVKEINKANVTGYNVIGILETIKQEVFLELENGEK